jgi:hypothetical protein
MSHISKDKNMICVNNAPDIANYCLNSVEEIAQLSGIEISRYAGQRVWKINGELVTKSSFISSRGSKICPECLTDAAYLRGSWMLSFYTSCAIHQNKLINECPICVKQLKSTRRNITHCDCGADLREVKTTPAPSSSLLISQIIDQKINNFIHIKIDLAPFQEIEKLANLSLDGLCKTLWFLGHCVSNLGNYGSGQGKKILSIDEADHIIYAAIQLLQSWPNKLGKTLEGLSERPPKNQWNSLINSLFGPAQYYLQTEITSDELFYVRTAYEQHIRRIWNRISQMKGYKLSPQQLELDSSW